MTVVAGVDGSELTPRVIRRAIQEAEARATDLHVVYVFHPPVFPALDVAYDYTKLADSARDGVWEMVCPLLDHAPVPVTTENLEGYPPDTLVAYTENVGADLLVLGSRGRGELASLILGSTSHRAVQLAHCDVLIVRPPAEE